MTLPRPHGTGRNLLDAYRVLPQLRSQWRFTLYHQQPRAEAHPENPAACGARNVTWRLLDIPGDRLDLWLHLRLPLAAWFDGIDLLHFPANTAPLFCPVPYVVTIHDLIPVRLSNTVTACAARAFRRGVERAVRGAVGIITPSAATRADLETYFGVEAARVSIVPWAPDSLIGAECTAEQRRDDIERVSSRYGLCPPWLVTFSGSSARKNATGLLAAFARVNRSARESTRLLLVGCEPQSRRDALTGLAAELGIADRCRVLGFLPHEDLPALLRGSRGLLIPSRWEGFGLPILDAFACDVPVLAGRSSSLPEVAGDAALYCDPDDPESIARGIEHLLDPQTARELVARGQRRVQEFTWRRTAEAMGEVYERAAAEARFRFGEREVRPAPRSTDTAHSGSPR